MMKKLTQLVMALIVVMAFVAIPALAPAPPTTPSPPTSPLTDLWKAINGLQTQIDDLKTALENIELTPGAACWDLNEDRDCDTGTEDKTLDGNCDVNDCQGVECWDLNGNGVCDTGTEDKTGDLKCDVLDCQGPKGDTGATGADGATGPQGLKGDKGDPGTAPYLHPPQLLKYQFNTCINAETDGFITATIYCYGGSDVYIYGNTFENGWCSGPTFYIASEGHGWTPSWASESIAAASITFPVQAGRNWKVDYYATPNPTCPDFYVYFTPLSS